MKQLNKITLAKAYDVLSESEMKNIVGGDHPDSGSGVKLIVCSGLKETQCSGYCRVNSTTIGKCKYQPDGQLVRDCYCEHPSAL